MGEVRCDPEMTDEVSESLPECKPDVEVFCASERSWGQSLIG